MGIFIAVYFIALIIEVIIRVLLDRKRRQEKMSERRVTSQEQILLGLLTLGGLVAQLFMRRPTGWILRITHSLLGQAGLVSCSRRQPSLSFGAPMRI